MQHYTTLVNREHPLDACYVPEDLAVCRFPFCAEVGEEKRMLCRAAAEAAGRLIEYGNPSVICCLESQGIVRIRGRKRFMKRG